MDKKEVIARWVEETLRLTASEQISVSHSTDEMGVLFTATIPDRVAGFIIGKQGQTIGNVRKVLSSIGAHNDMKACLKIVIQ